MSKIILGMFIGSVIEWVFCYYLSEWKMLRKFYKDNKLGVRASKIYYHDD